ncbi:tRNA glutamyl-Q(34) synthetase GluQRS [Guyparkeria hydrothermalis]|uniref:tRNA glutamyl-Q(34) synthetase GluQRS n=1 Tax=Guyparkeria hydrothermalis TaxID=923 RepID=UPI002021ADD9|nr:tRNA glutamyl-Q(34) synthetase GluQRS [Guyparkeria hydrothermalis]MCL7745372.1 tRNA glutamyl-Q(34) synthetase GluQRS [Guyparkeria hydrothermalis]
MTSTPPSQDRYHGRFAPTPSGPLHAGSLVAALGSFLDARAQGGRWSVRIDDTDEARSRPEAIDAILAQLEAHGLKPDGSVIFQSRRRDHYEEALEQLAEAGRVYRCGCTRAHLRAWAAEHGQTMGAIGPVYPGFCREKPAAEDERHALRFRVGDTERRVADRRLGSIRQRLAAEVGDPVLRRADGPIAYHLANVVDDAAMGITQVVRGEDLAELTPLHVELAEALGLTAPGYFHLPLVNGPDGRKLSKTNHARPLDNREAAANLDVAAAVLGLQATSGASISERLDRWIGEWRQRHPLPAAPT